jgi:hypothetical protein
LNFIEEEYKSKKWLFVRLSIWPQTVEELCLIRFWLSAISNTCFQRVSFFELFNPEFLGLLFPPASTPSPVKFRAAELLTFPSGSLPPLAYGPLVCAHAVDFDGFWVPFPDLLQLVCAFTVPPHQVQAGNQASCSDLEHLFFKVSHFLFSCDLRSNYFLQTPPQCKPFPTF